MNQRDHEPILTARGLGTGYGKRKVISGVDLSVGRGEFIGVMGPNGSGKTTLIRGLTGVLKPWEGEVAWRGDRTVSPVERAKTVAVVSQTSEGGLDLPVEEVVLLGRLPYFGKFQWWPSARDREVVAWALEATESEKLRRENFRDLSGGEQQRVRLARALAQKPELIILDEPTQHLDINYQVEIFNLLRRLNGEYGLTVLAVLHDLNLAAAYCRRLIFLKSGEVLKDGPVGELITERAVEELFNVRVGIFHHPESGRPLLYPLTNSGK